MTIVSSEGLKHSPAIITKNRLMVGQFLRDGDDKEFSKNKLNHTFFLESRSKQIKCFF